MHMGETSDDCRVECKAGLVLAYGVGDSFGHA